MLVEPIRRVFLQRAFRHCAALFGVLTILDWICGALGRGGNPTALVWPGNGIAVALLLCAGRVADRRILPAVIAASLLSNLLIGRAVPLAILFTLCNLVEVVGAVAMLLPLGRGCNLLSRRAMPRFVVAVLGCAAAGAVGAGLTLGNLRAVVPVWLVSHAFGLAMVTPSVVDLRRGRLHAVMRRAWRRPSARMALGVSLFATVAVFAQARYPLVFLLPLPMLALLAELGAAGITLPLLPLALATAVAAATNRGPFSINARLGPDERIVLSQLFLLAAFATCWRVGLILRDRRRAEISRDAERERLAASERRYRLLAENALDVVSRVDADGIRRYVSPSCTHVFGAPSAILLDRDDLACVHPDDRDTVRSAHAALGTGSIEDATLTYRLERPDGTVCWVEERVRAVRHPATGAFDGHVSVTRDVTERHRLELDGRARETVLELANLQLERLMRHLARARDQAEDASRAKSSFLAGVSHELRTPLNGILGHAELLRLEGGLAPAQAVRLEAMLSAGDHLLRMINAVLDLSTIEADRIDCNVVRVDLLAELQAAVALVAPTAEAKRLSVGFEQAPDAPRSANADPVRLRQILVNLLGNAVKFTPAGSVSARTRPGPAGRVCVDVVDTGPGIKPERRVRLFREFDRLDIEQASSVEGAGLGLSLSARLAMLMDGTLSHADNPAGGCIFTIELPAGDDAALSPSACADKELSPSACADGELASPPGADAEIRGPVPAVGAELPSSAVADAGSCSPSGADASSGAPAASLRILVVDDVAMNRDVACAFLRSGGHEAHEADGGAAAIAMLGRERFDVVLMDTRMPGMDGLDATRLIRTADTPSRDVPIIAFTAQAFSDQVDACLRAGMNSHLTKPVTREGLLRAVAAAARRDDAGVPGFPSSVAPRQLAVAASALTSAEAPSPDDTAGRDGPGAGASRPGDATNGDAPIFDALEFGRVASFLDVGAVESCLEILTLRAEALLDALERTPRADRAELVAAAHALAGSGGTFGFTRLAVRARRLEQVSASGSSAAALAEADRDLADTLRDTVATLRDGTGPLERVAAGTSNWPGRIPTMALEPVS